MYWRIKAGKAQLTLNSGGKPVYTVVVRGNCCGLGPQQVTHFHYFQKLAMKLDSPERLRLGPLEVNIKTGETLNAEILAQTADPGAERIILFYKPSLDRLGINVNVRSVDDIQYENRLRNWDFDIIIASWPESLSPGNEQRDYWGSPAADTPGSRNYIGIKNPAVDALIERVIFSKDRAELVAVTKALDRVLLWNNYVVPQFTYGKSRTARWDRFGRPDPLPKYASAAFPTVWWWDAEKAARTGTRQ